MSFMFGVLGSVMFWVIFIGVGFFIGSLLLRYLAPIRYSEIVNNHRICGNFGDPVAAFFLLIIIFLFWPIVLAGVIVVFIIRKALWPIFCKSIKATVSLVPDIEIKKRADKAD